MIRWVTVAAALAVPVSAANAPVAPADATAVQALVQKTWSRFGASGIPKGPRFDPPRTPAFAKGVLVYQKTLPGEEAMPDNIYCQCFNEYKPHLLRVSLDGATPDVIEAHTTVADSSGFPNTVIWRLVRMPQGWALDDIWSGSGPISVQRRTIKNGRRL